MSRVSEHGDGVGRPPTGVGLHRRLTPRSIQVALGCFWIFDAALQFQPALFRGGLLTHVLKPSAMGQSAPIAWTINTAAHFIRPDVGVWNFLFASIQLLIGLGLLYRRTVKPAIVVMAVWAFGVWWLGEGLGMLFMPMASPLTGAPGAVLLYAVIGFLVWPTDASPDPDAAGIAASPSARGPFGASAAFMAWTGFWLLSAFLWLLPTNRSGGAVSAQLAGAATNQPVWYAHLLHSLSATVGTHASSLPWVLAVVSVVIGLGPLCSRRPGVFLALGVVLELSYWVTGMAVGSVMTGFGTDPNSGPVVALLAVAMIPATATMPSVAPIRAILQRHPVGVGATAAASFAALLLSSTYPVAAASSSAAPAPHRAQTAVAPSGSSMPSMSMSTSSGSAHSSAPNMAGMAGLGVTDRHWKYTGPPLPTGEVSELTSVSAQTDAGHRMQTPNCSATPTAEQVLGATQYVQATSAAVAKYKDLNVAKADGYYAITNPNYPVVHYLNLSYMNSLDVMKPNTVDSLVYATTPYGPVLVAAMFLMPGQGAGPMPYGCLVQWHQHTNLCTNDRTGRIEGFTPCAPGTSHRAATPEMTHVWQVPVAGGPLAMDPSDLQVVEAAVMAQQQGLAPTTTGVPPPLASTSGSAR